MKRIILILLILGCISTIYAQNEPYPPVPDEVTDQITYPPVPKETEPPLPDEEKIQLPDMPITLLFQFNIKEGKVILLKKEVVYGAPKGNAISINQINVELLDEQGELLEEFGIMDPRIRIVEENGIMFDDDVDFVVSSPVYHNMGSVSLINASTKETLIQVEIRQDIQNFCEQVKYEDPQCRILKYADQVGENPDFFISIDPKKVDAKSGDTIRYMIKITTKDGFYEPITGKLIITGPGDTSMEYELPEIYPPYPLEFEQSITIPENTLPGTYTGKIIATGGGITKEDSVETNVPFISGMFTLLLLVIVGLGMRRCR